MAVCLIHRHRGLAVLVRSYRDHVRCAVNSYFMFHRLPMAQDTVYHLGLDFC